MKKKINRLAILLLTLVISLLFGSCKDKFGGYTHPDFQTEYTEEEHIQRISALTEKKFAKELQNGEIESYDVEIVYAFYDEDPEFFMVTVKYAKHFFAKYGDERSILGQYIAFYTKYKYYIGYIKKDEYYQSSSYYGRSPYELLGFQDAKKYYGALRYGVKTDEGILQIYDAQYRGSCEYPLPNSGSEAAVKQVLLTEEQQRKYMNGNYDMFPKKYYLEEEKKENE